MEDRKGSAASRVQLTVKVAFITTRSGAWTLTAQKTLDVQRARVKLNIVVPIILRIGKVVQEKFDQQTTKKSERPQRAGPPPIRLHAFMYAIAMFQIMASISVHLLGPLLVPMEVLATLMSRAPGEAFCSWYLCCACISRNCSERDHGGRQEHYLCINYKSWLDVKE
jgi:hypothetical protein